MKRIIKATCLYLTDFSLSRSCCGTLLSDTSQVCFTRILLRFLKRYVATRTLKLLLSTIANVKDAYTSKIVRGTMFAETIAVPTIVSFVLSEDLPKTVISIFLMSFIAIEETSRLMSVMVALTFIFAILSNFFTMLNEHRKAMSEF